jgi:hypothetical protein
MIAPPMWTRRRLLGIATLAGAGVIVGAGQHLLALPDVPAVGMRTLGEGDVIIVRAAIQAYFPAGALGGKEFPTAAVAGVAIDVGAAIHQIDDMASGLYERERRLLLAALRSLEQWPRLSAQSTSSFSSLPSAQQQQVLQAFEQSTVAERRLLAASVRQLVAVGVFEQRLLIRAIGYTPGCPTVGGFT